MTDSRSEEKSLRELEFNDFIFTLNYGTAFKHLDFDFMMLNNVFVLSWGLTITQNSIRTNIGFGYLVWPIPDPAENASIGTDTDPEYRTDASLL